MLEDGDQFEGTYGVRDVLEDISFGDDGGAGADLEGVTRVGVPVVVDLAIVKLL
jgi:hypothetical protein